jgi:hypothetical protein
MVMSSSVVMGLGIGLDYIETTLLLLLLHTFAAATGHSHPGNWGPHIRCVRFQQPRVRSASIYPRMSQAVDMHADKFDPQHKPCLLAGALGCATYGAQQGDFLDFLEPKELHHTPGKQYHFWVFDSTFHHCSHSRGSLSQEQKPV